VTEPYITHRHISTVLTGVDSDLLAVGERCQPYGGTVVVDQCVHLTLKCGKIRRLALGPGD
jgi:hypothetical protein